MIHFNAERGRWEASTFLDLAEDRWSLVRADLVAGCTWWECRVRRWVSPQHHVAVGDGMHAGLDVETIYVPFVHSEGAPPMDLWAPEPRPAPGISSMNATPDPEPIATADGSDLSGPPDRLSRAMALVVALVVGFAAGVLAQRVFG